MNVHIYNDLMDSIGRQHHKGYTDFLGKICCVKMHFYYLTSKWKFQWAQA